MVTTDIGWTNVLKMWGRPDNNTHYEVTRGRGNNAIYIQKWKRKPPPCKMHGCNNTNFEIKLKNKPPAPQHMGEGLVKLVQIKFVITPSHEEWQRDSYVNLQNKLITKKTNYKKDNEEKKKNTLCMHKGGGSRGTFVPAILFSVPMAPHGYPASSFLQQ